MSDTQAAVLRETETEAAQTPDFRRLGRAEQRRILVALIQDGRNDEEIGQLYGLSQWQVRNLRYRLGIKKDRGGNVHVDQTDGLLGGAAGAGGVLEAFPALDVSGGVFAFTMAGNMTAAQLAQRLAGLQSLFASVNPEGNFEVRLQITEGVEAS